MRDMLGIEQGLAVPSAQTATAGVMPGQRATLEHTTADRVANVKGLMGQNGMAASHGFGVAGGNMQVALYTPQQQQQLAYQQQLAAYQTAVAQQQMAAYQTMNAQQQMAYQTNMAAQQQQMMMYQTNMAQQQMMVAQQQQVALYVPAPAGNALVPAMEAQRVERAPSEYRVQRSAERKRVSDSDKAFGPLQDRLKKMAAQSAAQRNS